jgi:hypothetical protein
VVWALPFGFGHAPVVPAWACGKWLCMCVPLSDSGHTRFASISHTPLRLTPLLNSTVVSTGATCTAANCATCAAGSTTACSTCKSGFSLANGVCSQGECSLLLVWVASSAAPFLLRAHVPRGLDRQTQETHASLPSMRRRIPQGTRPLPREAASASTSPPPCGRACSP